MRAQEAEGEHGLERHFGVGGMDASEDIDSFGADEDARVDGAVDIAQSCAEDGHRHGLGGRGAGAEAGTLEDLRDVELALQGRYSRRCG